MSNVCAGIGRGQMTVLNDRIAARRANFDLYVQRMASLPGVSFVYEPDGYFCNRWLTTILIDPALSNGITRETLRLAMDKENIESRPLWKPMHLQPVFQGSPYYGDKTSEHLFANGLCLPSGSNLVDKDFDRIFAVVDEVWQLATA